MIILLHKFQINIIHITLKLKDKQNVKIVINIKNYHILVVVNK
jgi:hypothetical protein